MEMTERVARAIHNAGGGYGSMTWEELLLSVNNAPSSIIVSYHASVMKKARAAIEAMREPDKAMVIAGDEAKDSCIDSDYSSDMDGNREEYTIINSDLPAIVWRAMIDEALSPSEDKHG